MRKVMICLMIFGLMCGRSWAGEGPDAAHIESVKEKVAACVDGHRRVAVETYDERRLQGVIREAGATDFVLSFGGREMTLAYSDVKKIKWPSAAWRQVKLMAGAAALVGVIVGLVVVAGGLKG